MVRTAAVLEHQQLSFPWSSYDRKHSHVNERPLTASLCGNLNRNRLVLWFTSSELSNASDTNAGPAPNTFGGAPDSADALFTNSLEYAARPIPPAATVAAMVAGRTRRNVTDAILQLTKDDVCRDDMQVCTDAK